MSRLPELDDATVRELAEHAGVCVRPIVRKLVDLATGEERVIPIPCGSTKSRVCPPCAEKARQLRITQCLEGWHRTDDPELEEPDDTDELDADPDADQLEDEGGELEDEGGSEQLEGDDAHGLEDEPSDDGVESDAERSLARRVRSTKRRDDVGKLPKKPTTDTTLGRTYTSPDGKTYRPSMFLTFTLPSYGRVRRDGTPCDPKRYDYRKAALDALHFPKLVDASGRRYAAERAIRRSTSQPWSPRNG